MKVVISVFVALAHHYLVWRKRCAQNCAYEAQVVDKHFQSNWKSTEIKLKVADLT